MIFPVDFPNAEVKVDINDLTYGNIIATALTSIKLFLSSNDKSLGIILKFPIAVNASK